MRVTAGVRSTRGGPSRGRWYVLGFALFVLAGSQLGFSYYRRLAAAQAFSGLGTGVAVGASEIDSWVQVHQVAASVLARVAASEITAHPPTTAANRALLAERLGALLDSTAVQAGYAVGWVLDGAGAVIAGPPGAPTGARASGVTLVRQGDDAALDFAMAAGSSPSSPLVVLRAPLRVKSFARINPRSVSAPRSARTSLITRVGDSIVVVLTQGPEDAPAPRRSMLASQAPEVYRRALARDAAGEAGGTSGRTAFYASHTVKALGLPLIREIAADESLASLRLNMVVLAVLVGLILALAIAVADQRVRASRLRREHELTELRSNFVSSVSHELRTPLAQIRMFAELMRKGSLRDKDDLDRGLRVIEKESRRLGIMVDNILNFTRLRREEASVSPVPTDVSDAIAHVIEAFAPLAAERGVTVRNEGGEELVALVDSQALRQVLVNFLENATRYGPSQQQIVVGADEHNGEVVVWVDDQGPGVPVAERQLIWEPFVRGETGRRTDSTGSGIGLSVVHDLVKRNGGSVSVESSPSGGARFIARFPALTDPLQ
ncbi:MAG: ATP-binding region ATPase domain protein [Gemmatimonadetes bacterium]|nr:ATP-binding region ATPase domain protein [Gemmatimonadota bacterium]